MLRDRNLQAVFAVTLIAVLGVASIAPALPRIAAALGLSPQQVGLLVTVFTVPGVLLTPVAGVLADRVGRRRILVPSLLLFALAGAGCALAGSFGALLALRVIQGVGAAPLGALNVTLIGDLYHGDRRTAAMGYNSAVLSVGTASYPALGGALAQLSWHAPFLLALLALPAAAAVALYLRNPEPTAEAPLREYFGAVWQSLRHQAVLALFAIGVITFVMLYGAVTTYFPIMMDERFRSAPVMIGAFLTASSVTTGLVSTVIGRLGPRFGEGRLVAAAFVLYAVALALVPLMRVAWLMVVPIAIFGAAMGLNLPSAMTLLTAYAPREHRAAFMSLNGMMLRLGQTIGPLAAGAAYASGGVDLPFYLGGALAAATLLLLLPFVPRRPVQEARST